MGSGATGHSRGGAVVGPQPQLPRRAERRTPQMGKLATAGAARPPMVRARAANGRLADKHGATRGAAAPLAMGTIEAFRMPCLGLLGVREPTPSVARGVITITIAIVHSCKVFLEVPLREEGLRLGGGSWRSVAAAGATLMGSFGVTDALSRCGAEAAIVVTAPSLAYTADCTPPRMGNAHGLDVSGSWTRAISDLGAWHSAAGSTTGASTHSVDVVATWASTTWSRGWPPLAVLLALRNGF
jgi:hypothetical protein